MRRVGRALAASMVATRVLAAVTLGASWPVALDDRPGEAPFVRGGQWLAAFPPRELRFDATLMLYMIRRTVDDESLRRAYETARPIADRDRDHPHRRLWDPAALAAPAATVGWEPPRRGQPRVNTNRVVSEAIHCDRNGWRRATTRYVCGPMRDGGGYHSTHGLWALALARERGCAQDAKAARCVRVLRHEIGRAQPPVPPSEAAADVDLFAERSLVLLLSGAPDARMDRWVEALLATQEDDGAFGRPEPTGDPYVRYHATAMALWVLAEWYRGRGVAP